MKFGSGFSISEPQDRTMVRDLAQSLDGAGFDFATLGGHVLGAPDGRYEGRPAMTYVGPFHDPFVLFGYLAGVTKRLHFITSILILPLMPTALVAKQSAELDYVSGGRFELGAGISWSPDEYEALGQNIKNRGRRLEEQIQLLRRFWQEPVVNFEGRYHHVNGLGLNRRPIDIPIWIGCGPDDVQLRRMAELADGWLPQGDPTEPLKKLREYLAAEGRDAAAFRVLGRVVASPEGPEAWVAAARHLQAAGVTHIGIGAAPGTPPAEGLAKILEARKVLSEALS